MASILRTVTALGFSCFLLLAQVPMTLEKLTAFIKSSVELKQSDKQVAAFLKTAKLSERLDAAAVEDLIRFRVGPNTLAALKVLSETSKGLPEPKRPEPVVAAAPPPPPSRQEQQEVIEKAREYALNYTKSLPDFICVQVTRRFIDPTGLEFWQSMDTITTRLSFFDQKEEYKVLFVNNRSVDVPYERLGGVTSSSEFGTVLRQLFEAKTRAEFQWLRWATLRGRRMHVFSYQVNAAHSEYSVSFAGEPAIKPAYTGLVFVDRDNFTVNRLRLEPQTPVGYPIQQISLELDYDDVDIAGTPFFLPLKSTLRSRVGKELSKNEIEFRLYRKFGTDTTITFGTPDPLPESQTKEQK